MWNAFYHSFQRLSTISRRRNGRAVDGERFWLLGQGVYSAGCGTLSLEDATHREQHAEMIGVVIGDEQRFAHDRLAAAVRNLGE